MVVARHWFLAELRLAVYMSCYALSDPFTDGKATSRLGSSRLLDVGEQVYVDVMEAVELKDLKV